MLLMHDRTAASRSCMSRQQGFRDAAATSAAAVRARIWPLHVEHLELLVSGLGRMYLCRVVDVAPVAIIVLPARRGLDAGAR